MWKKRFLILVLLISIIGVPSVFAEANIPDIEIFDIAKGQVQNRVANHVSIQKEVQLCLESITKLVQPLGDAPKRGKIVRIPLEPPILVENPYFEAMAHEVFLVLLPDKLPFFIIFNQERIPYLAAFSRDVTKLLNSLSIQPEK